MLSLWLIRNMYLNTCSHCAWCAKALIKLAVTGFECDSGADFFHAQQDLSRRRGSKLARHAATAEKHLIVAQAAEEKIPETATTAERQALKEQSLNARKDYDQARQVQTTYHENLRGVSDAIHPFSLSDSSPNDAEKIAERLEARAKAFEQLSNRKQADMVEESGKHSSVVLR